MLPFVLSTPARRPRQETASGEKGRLTPPENKGLGQALLAGETDRQMVTEVPQDCGSSGKAPHPVKTAQEGFLEEAGHGVTEVAAHDNRGAKEGLERQVGVFVLCPGTKFSKKQWLAFISNDPQH